RFQFHGPRNKSIERVAFGILEEEHRPALLLREGDRANSPGRTEIVFEGELVLHLLDGCRSRMLNHRRQGEKGRWTRLRVPSSTAVQDELSILMKRFKSVMSKLHYTITTPDSRHQAQ